MPTSSLTRCFHSFCFKITISKEATCSKAAEFNHLLTITWRVHVLLWQFERFLKGDLNIVCYFCPPTHQFAFVPTSFSPLPSSVQSAAGWRIYLEPRRQKARGRRRQIYFDPVNLLLCLSPSPSRFLPLFSRSCYNWQPQITHASEILLGLELFWRVSASPVGLHELFVVWSYRCVRCSIAPLQMVLNGEKVWGGAGIGVK